MPEAVPHRWLQGRAAASASASDRLAEKPWPRPGLATAMLRGLAGRCPCCGTTPLFTGWLRQKPVCTDCHAPLGAVRADDAPPYFVIFLVAHVVIGTQVLLDSTMALSTMAEAAIFLPLALALRLGLLRPVKGATVGLMLQLDMVEVPHG